MRHKKVSFDSQQSTTSQQSKVPQLRRSQSVSTDCDTTDVLTSSQQTSILSIKSAPKSIRSSSQESARSGSGFSQVVRYDNMKNQLGPEKIRKLRMNQALNNVYFHKNKNTKVPNCINTNKSNAPMLKKLTERTLCMFNDQK